MTRFGLLSLALAAVLVGCDTSGGPSVNYVEGVVTLDGQPVEGVTVGFSPVGDKGIPATGLTDANGVFKLTSTQGGKPEAGAAAGEYQVTFIKQVTETGTGSTGSTPEASKDPNYGKIDYSRKPLKVEYVVPQKYENPATSGFTVTVKPGKNTGDDFKFALTKQ